MFINPTIEFLTHRAAALVAQLSDKDAPHTIASVIPLMAEYDNVAQAMRAIRHPDLKPAEATYEAHEGTLWAWHCHEHRLHESHDARTVVRGAVGITSIGGYSFRTSKGLQKGRAS